MGSFGKGMGIAPTTERIFGILFFFGGVGGGEGAT